MPIISNNCIMTTSLKRYNMKYDTPTIGLQVLPEEFLKFCLNIDKYLKEDLVEYTDFSQEHKTMLTHMFGYSDIEYPCALCGDILIVFQHYKDFAEGRSAWYRRRKRCDCRNLGFIFYVKNDSYTKEALDFYNSDLKDKLVITENFSLPLDSDKYSYLKIENGCFPCLPQHLDHLGIKEMIDRHKKPNIYTTYPYEDWENGEINFTKKINENTSSALDYRIPRTYEDFIKYKDLIHNVFLVEPEELHSFVDQPDGYNFIRNNYDKFDNIFTWDTDILKLPNAKFLPWGGVWTESIGPKTKNLSIVASNKTFSNLHKQRYDLAWYMKKNNIGDTYGTFDGGSRVDPGVPLASYRFSIAIENYIYDYWFTEKICNCFATKTVPIYIGANKINEFFNKDGIIQVNNIEEIKELLKDFNYEEEYNKRKNAIEDNYKRVQEFKSPFNYLYKHYYNSIGGDNAMKELTIVIPVYNQKELIKKCLDSIPKDNRIEIIVIDDYSTDGTREILKNYDNIRVFYNKQNEGPGYSRNIGLDKANGKYIMFLDSDDYLFSDELSKFFKLFKEDYDLIFYALEENNGHIIDVTKDNKGACGTIKIIKKDFIGKLRFPLISKAEDRYFHNWLMNKHPRIYYSHTVLAHYNYPREGSITDISKSLDYEVKDKKNYHYLVEATDLYEKENIKDNQLDSIPSKGKQWWVSKERLDTLTWNNKFSNYKPFVYLLYREEKKPEVEL